MKKLKIALTLLFALSCSLFLFACGGDQYVADMTLGNPKSSFKEGEAFSTEGLSVTVWYQSNQDKAVELKEGDYDVDTSDLDRGMKDGKFSDAGTYTVVVTPKGQPSDVTPFTKSYDIVVDHNWTTNADGSITCPCGAKQLTYEGLEDVITIGDWGSAATVTRGGEGKTYPDLKDPVAGEVHASLGTLVSGQQLTVTLEIQSCDSEGWDTPLMGVRDGSAGVLPREDAYVIGGGPAGAFTTPDGGTKDTGPTSGTAVTAEAGGTPWLVYKTGDSWGDALLQPNAAGQKAVVDITYNYGMDGIFSITHALTTADGAAKNGRYTFVVPDSGYELVAYGEQVSYKITKAVYVENRALKEGGFTATAPTAKTQAEGKMFDKTGSTTVASFTKGNDLKDVGNYYAYVGEGEAETRVNLGVAPLTAGMHDFCVEFGGQTVWFTEGGAKGGASLITVVPTYVKGANATAITVNNVQFESENVTVDYALDASGKIELVVIGSASALTDEQKAVFAGTSATHFIAFRLLGYKAAFNAAASDAANVKVAAVAGELVDAAAPDGARYYNVDVVAALTSAGGNFSITLSGGEETIPAINVNLTGLDVTSAQASAKITANDFYLDAGGTYTVEYTAVEGTFSNDYKLVVGSSRPTVKQVQDAGADGYRITKNIYIKSATISSDGKKITAVYSFAAPDLGNLTADNAKQTVSLRNAANESVASVTLYYQFRVSASTQWQDIGEGVYVVPAGDQLYVVKLVEKDEDVRDADLGFTASLNIQNAQAAVTNVGVGVTGGAAAYLDLNEVTGASTAKTVVLGTINENGDNDRAALTFASVTIPNRAEDKAAVYYFTAEEALTENGKDSYVVYKVEGDAITATTMNQENWGSLIKIQEGNCVLSEIQAYGIDLTPSVTDAAQKEYFYYGARITAPARGYHEWHATDDPNKMKCDECGYIRTRTENGLYIMVPEVGTPIANTDTGADWWDGVVGTRKVTGDFLVQYTWQNIRDNNYTSAVVQLYDADAKYFNATIFETNADVANNVAATQLNAGWGDLNKNTTVKGYKDGELFFDSARTEGNDISKAFSLGLTDNLFRGNYTMTYARLGSTLYVIVTLEQKVATGTPSQTEIEATETTGCIYTVVYTSTNFTASDLTAEIAGNPVGLDNFTVRTGSAEELWATVEQGGKSYEISFGQASKVVVANNERENQNDWWGYGGTGALVVSGDFAIRYSWLNKDANYIADMAVEIHSNTEAPQYWGMRTFVCDYNPAPGNAELFSEGYQITHEGTFNGQKAEPKENLPVGIDLNLWGDCTATVTIYRIGTTLTIVQEVASAENTAKVVSTVTNFTTSEITVQVNGNLHNTWVQNVTRAVGVISEVKA